MDIHLLKLDRTSGAAGAKMQSAKTTGTGRKCFLKDVSRDSRTNSGEFYSRGWENDGRYDKMAGASSPSESTNHHRYRKAVVQKLR